LGLDPNKTDTDGDGLPDDLEILMFSDPTDPTTEDEGFNDYELYYKMGMYPPMHRRELPDPKAPPPKVYPDDFNPSTTIYPITKKRGCPLYQKYKKLMDYHRKEEALKVKDMFIKMAIYNLYGEEGLVAYIDSTNHSFALMRRTEEWDTSLYGSLDSDFDGIPDGLEQSGRLFGGENYNNYGIHYWEEDLRLRMAYITGTTIDGIDPREYINDTLWDEYGIVFISTEWRRDSILGIDGFDTEKDGLDDYAEYLWCSCPLLKHSDPSSGAPNDHDKVIQEFIPPRMDWIADFQDWDDDSIPNGAELYYIPELDLGIFDPYCRSTDYDQYSDRIEWMGWFYKHREEEGYEYPLDDPIPFVVRNGAHPLIPAYPVPYYENTENQLHVPFAEVVKSARKLEGEDEISFEFENKVSAEVKWTSFIPKADLKVEGELSAESEWKVSEGWELNTETEYDLGECHVWNWFKLKNKGTEPFDRSPTLNPYCKFYVDICWPGDANRIYSPMEEISGFDALIPEGCELGGGEEYPDEMEIYIEHPLNERIGIEIEPGETGYSFNLGRFNALYITYGVGSLASSISLALMPVAGLISSGIALVGGYIWGLALEHSYSADLYKKFIDDFADGKHFIINPRRKPTYNYGTGEFSCDNLCDWTSVEAAHRNYVTVMCVYPRESPYINVFRESPIKEISGSDTVYYTLKEIIDKYSSGASGPPKIEPFFWSSDDAETLVQVGCLPNVPYDSVWIPPDTCDCDTIDHFGHWLVITSIDTVADPSRVDDLCRIVVADTETISVCGKLVLKPGDVIIAQYIEDHDNDSLEDKMELIAGTNPYKKDTDNDGLYDGTEYRIGLDPLDPNSDGSYYGAKDGDEMYYFDSTAGHRLPVITFEGDTIDTFRVCWDSVLAHSPREDSLIEGSDTIIHKEFVPWVYNSGGYNSQLDDQYMDANVNGLADWVEHYFRDPNNYWDGRFKVVWDGPETRENPYGYLNVVLESRGVKVDTTYPNFCDTFTLADGNRGLRLRFEDITGEGATIWDNSYIYCKLYNCDITVNQYMEVSYDLMPLTANGRHICVEFIFDDKTRSITNPDFVDLEGIRMHPAARPDDIPLNEFSHVCASLAPFAGKKIVMIAIGYEDNPNTANGLVDAIIDNFQIRNKNLVLTFEPDSRPEEGFNLDSIYSGPYGIIKYGGFDGMPSCTLSMLTSPNPADTPTITIDTMKYGPRGMVYDVSGYVDPFMVRKDSARIYVEFSLLPEPLEYVIDDCTTLGYYIWQQESPYFLPDRPDMQPLIPPKVVIDLKIQNPTTGEVWSMIDYCAAIGETLYDQWGNPYFPWLRNEMDPDSNNTYRPVSGDYWRYIDVQLPDTLKGWIIQDVLVRYESNKPFVGNFRSYIDNVSIFMRCEDVYKDTFGVLVNFGDDLKDEYDNNDNSVVDWEEIHIHNIPNEDLESFYVKHTYASLLWSNDIGPWSYDVDSVSGDTTWHWYLVDEVSGDTAYSWYPQFAMDTSGGDSTYKYPHIFLAPRDSYTTLIDVDSFSNVIWEPEDSFLIYGYSTNIPGDIDQNHYKPNILCWRMRDSGEDGILRITVRDSDSVDVFSIPESTLLVEVDTVNSRLFDKHGLILKLAYRRVSEDIPFDFAVGYKLVGRESVVWFDLPEPTDTLWHSARFPVPDLPPEDSVRKVQSVWVRADTYLAAMYMDDLSLRRIFVSSFEPDDTLYFVPNNLTEYENVNPASASCEPTERSGVMPPVPDGTHYLRASVDLTGFDPAGFTFVIFEFPEIVQPGMSGFSKISYDIYYHYEPYEVEGTAIIDVELADTVSGDTTWVSMYNLRAHDGRPYVPRLRGDPTETWNHIVVDLAPIPDISNKVMTKIALRFEKNSVIGRGRVEILVDNLEVSF